MMHETAKRLREARNALRDIAQGIEEEMGQ